MRHYDTILHELSTSFDDGQIYTGIQTATQGLPQLAVLEEMMANISLLPYWQQQASHPSVHWADTSFHLESLTPAWESRVRLIFSTEGFVLSCLKEGCSPWRMTMTVLPSLGHEERDQIITTIRQRVSFALLSSSRINCTVFVREHTGGQDARDSLEIKEAHISVDQFIQDESGHWQFPFTEAKEHSFSSSKR